MKFQVLTILILLLLPFCNVLGQKIEAIDDSTFVCDRDYVEFIAEKFDSLERIKAIEKACQSTLNAALVYKDSCYHAIIDCETLHDSLVIKSEQQSAMIQVQKEQIAILNRSNTFLNDQIKKQRRSCRKDKIFAAGGGVIGGAIVTAVVILLAR